MILRIVKLTFQPELVPQFMEVFEASKDAIRAFEGCRDMRLMGNPAQSNLLFTVSEWQSEAALEVYRNSDLFKATWAKTKVLFADKPEAWSLSTIDEDPLRFM
jgi:quinol monooxygenase YgiN